MQRPDAPAATRLPNLVFWTLLGLAGCAAVIGGGFANDWIAFAVGLFWTLASLAMLESGWWMRWPRG